MEKIISYANKDNVRIMSILYGFKTFKKYNQEYELKLLIEYFKQSLILERPEQMKIPDSAKDIKSRYYTIAEIITFYCIPNKIQIKYWEDYEDFIESVIFISQIRDISKIINDFDKMNIIFTKSPRLINDKTFYHLMENSDFDNKLKFAKSCIKGWNIKHFKMILSNMLDIRINYDYTELYDSCGEFWNFECLEYLFKSNSKGNFKFQKCLENFYFYDTKFMNLLENEIILPSLWFKFHKIYEREYLIYPNLLFNLSLDMIKITRKTNRILYNLDKKLLGTILDIFESNEIKSKIIFLPLIKKFKSSFYVNFRNISGYMIKDFVYSDQERKKLDIESEKWK